MNFNKIITSITLFATAIFVNAQQHELPQIHQEAADQKIATSIISDSFMDKAFNSAREHADLAIADVNVSSENDIDMALAGQLVDYARRFLGTKYVWGATGPSSFDCSGFTSYVYRNFGLILNRTSSMQFTQGERVSEVRDMKPGDLLFFSSRRSGPGNVGHVAMVVSVDPENNTCEFIHASTKKGVTYQTFPDNAYYSKNFIGAKRILGNLEVAENK